MAMPTGPTGPGIKRGWPPSPAVVAQRLERMNRGRVAKRAEREAEARALGEELSGLSLDALRTRISTRYWTAAIYHVGGYSAVEIARVLGYAQVDGAMRVLKHPVVVRVIGLLREAQMQRVLRGEFGVAATAKAAAPQVMQHVVELAGAQKDAATGERVGRAKRDADALRAAELTLTVSGDKVERKAMLHLHVLEEMSEAELEALAADGQWPERYRGVGLLAGPGEGEP
jgi:hypothetical protein